MSTKIEFETPENIQVAYQPAGLGTRFLAWFVDNLLMFVFLVVLFVVLLVVGMSTESVARQLEGPLRGTVRDPADPRGAESFETLLYFWAIFSLVAGLGSFFYYGIFEFLMRGQTPGKRASKIRVVRIDGFSLEAGSIFIRNVFRIIDHLPPLWIVPLVSAKSQRFGDMVAGTIVVSDRQDALGEVRTALSTRTAGEAKFQFDVAKLKRARPQDFQAIERILDRWDQLSEERQDAFLDQIVPPLVARLQVEMPDEQDHLQFLTDLLAAEYRRQHRSLG